MGDRLEVILYGGVQRGAHVLNALSLGTTAVWGGRLYLYTRWSQQGSPALALLEAEIVRGMKLMGKKSIDQLGRDNLRRRSQR